MFYPFANSLNAVYFLTVIEKSKVGLNFIPVIEKSKVGLNFIPVFLILKIAKNDMFGLEPIERTQNHWLVVFGLGIKGLPTLI